MIVWTPISLNIKTGTVMKNPEMLKLVPDYLKLNRCAIMYLKNYLDMFLINIRLKSV